MIGPNALRLFGVLVMVLFISPLSASETRFEGVPATPTLGFDRTSLLPPKVPPTAVLFSVESNAITPQTGLLIGSNWLVAGTPALQPPEASVTWPEQAQLPSARVRLVLQAPSVPARVRLTFSRKPDAASGRQVELNCGQRTWELLGGDRPDCFIDLEAESVVMEFDVPKPTGNWYIVAEATWFLPPDALGGAQMPLRQAWWAFAIHMVDPVLGTPVPLA
jgi:hypothetical protein